MGFAIPLSRWLRGRLKNWMCDTLNLNKIKSQNILNYKLVGTMIEDHIKNPIEIVTMSYGIFLCFKYGLISG